MPIWWSTKWKFNAKLFLFWRRRISGSSQPIESGIAWCWWTYYHEGAFFPCSSTVGIADLCPDYPANGDCGNAHGGKSGRYRRLIGR